MADWQEHRFDRRFGSDTTSLRSLPVVDAPVATVADGQTYEATTGGAFKLIVRQAVRDAARWTFMDIGSGKGKVLLLAAESGFRHMIGVEHSESLAATAQENIDRYGERRPHAPTIEGRHGDATTTPLPDGPLFVFLYNPFGAETMGAFGRHLATRGQQPLIVAYANPLQEAALLDPFSSLRRTRIVESLLMKPCHLYSNGVR